MFSDFEASASAVLRYLQQRLGFGLWMVTRTEGEDWIVLSADDREYGVVKGDVFDWSESLCARMVRGEGPQVAPDVSAVPAYAAAPLARRLQIGAYLGVPLILDDGSLFGTLCALDRVPCDPRVADDLALIELQALLLSKLLNAELRLQEMGRTAERLQSEASRDVLTRLYNRRGWDELIVVEEERCRRYGHPACLLSVDVDDLKVINDSQGHSAGDELLRRAADALVKATRSTDVVARLGGDEFGVLAIECNAAGGRILEIELRRCLDEAGVLASVGLGVRRPETGLRAAFEDADANMYHQKRRRRVRSTLPKRIPSA